MSTKFFTNKADNSLLKKFEGVFKNLPNIHNFDALVGYFRATGYFKLRPFLNEIPDMMVYELYFTEYMKEKGLKVLEYINPKPFTEETTNEQKAVIIKNFYEWYQEPENAVRQRMLLIETRSPDILAVINGAT
ncbi:hypothetical protein N8294_00650 [Polaribacter sp.]|nr:hypothetical protein [Polaribacter sp.]MDC1373673.1 hypothetical protein [Polaribacter sp.]